MKLLIDFKRMLGKSKWRVFHVLFSRAFIGVLHYRLEHSLYLVFKRAYPVIRFLLLPVFFLLQAYSNCDIHYKAQIGKGIRIHHPSLGLVINGICKIGDYPIFTGGNCLGLNSNKHGDFTIGDFLEMGANATIIGPLTLGDHVVVGASSCVTKSYDSDLILVGLPAKPISS
ncbi:serine acetyltransferase [Gangjinia marincola]|uniref:Serine acetyltransferase n=1 Tax=Gangjinia marincola TaxID=578463 RepID=A0ABP3XSS5_9FLAO